LEWKKSVKKQVQHKPGSVKGENLSTASIDGYLQRNNSTVRR